MFLSQSLSVRKKLQNKKKEIRSQIDLASKEYNFEYEEAACRHHKMLALLSKQKRLSEIYCSFDKRENDYVKQEVNVIKKLEELDRSDVMTTDTSVVGNSSSIQFLVMSSEEIDRVIADFDFNDPFLLSEAA
ncbi:uncharacterized protein KY384_002733 [Bacidia gigantensis]|uniref:uncharacterized protein n=1 Tax=Bacidia gigantensis TaxID=2732470 RepID=UPI001D056F17|nr:uncharacterized protein KY384_002733 [Bacidia gigantensis]KAG8532855.1 hypothetical protein KY384_002733 [Bacidia gigantensis]